MDSLDTIQRPSADWLGCQDYSGLSLPPALRASVASLFKFAPGKFVKLARFSSCHPSKPMCRLAAAIFMAGVPGLEPGNAGIKIRCLTAWLHPNGTLVLHTRKWMSINPARDKTFEPFWAPFNDLCALTLVLHRQVDLSLIHI